MLTGLKSKNGIDIKFLYYQLLSKEIKSLGYSRHFKVIKKFRFAVTLPTEQKRIVAKLDSLFEKIDKAIELHQQNITNANTLMASTLDKTFKKLEGEWSLEKLDKLIKVVGGGTPSKSNEKYWDGSIKWATVRDMNVDIIVETDYRITEEGLKNSSSNIVPKDAIVIATRVGLGKVCYLKCDIAINQDLKGLLPNSQLLNLRYLFNFFKAIENYIVENGTGATVKGVKLDFIKAIKIPLPPLPIQQQIVAYLDSIATKIDEIKQLNVQKLENLKALKASILDKAFRGEM